MRIGILGANGFIGSHLFYRLNETFDCEIFDRKKYDLDIVDSMKPFVEDKDLIFHLAGANRAPNNELVRINTLGTINLLESIRKFSNQKTRMVFSSSMQVYGVSPDLKFFKENDIVLPNNAYGLSKLFAEEILEKYYEWYGIKSLVYRISNVYGYGCKPYYNSAIASFIDLMQHRKQISINGTGAQCRDFIYISDVIDAFFKATEYQFRGAEIFNICTGTPITINELLNSLGNVMDFAPSVEYNESSEPLNYLIGDPTEAKNNLLFTSQVKLEEGLRRTIDHKVF